MHPGWRAAAFVMPYLAVGLGLYAFHNAWAAILGYHAGILALITLGRGWQAARQFRLTKSLAHVVTFGLVGLLAGVGVALLWPLVGFSPRLPDALLAWGLTPQAWPWFIAYGALVNPWLEEAYWRGWLGSGSSRPVAADAFFGGFHLVILAPFVSVGWLAFAFLVLASTAWFWRQVTRRDGSLLAASLFHLTADVSILLVIVSEVL